MSEFRAGVVAVRLRLNAPFYEKGDELFAMDNEPTDVSWLTAGCEHTTTICPECIGSWAMDHELIALVIAGESGVQVVPMKEVGDDGRLNS